MRKKKSSIKNGISKLLFIAMILALVIICAYLNGNTIEYDKLFLNEGQTTASGKYYTYNNIEDIPEYSGEIYVTLNNNIPYFTEKNYTLESFENYSELDDLGRCGVAYANICKEIMPLEDDEREDISSIKPTGWKQEKYNGEYLYNRCHLIGYQLAGENANKLNLITGTRYFNVSGMLLFENEVADYIENNRNSHVLYRVTPVYEENNLLASGVEIEAYSVEDNGEGICFNVYIYNVQPGIIIDYKTGESYMQK